jgi:nitrite reductase/ring-hydroxylating ferredoxin subunit
MTGDGSITSVADVPDDSTFLFTVRNTETDERKEAILVRLNDEHNDGEGAITGWLNYCQHFTHIKLDKGSGAPMRNGELVCANHGAYFESDTGRCTYGPCEGAYLTELDLEIEDGTVSLADDDYEFVATGPMETDDLDLSSKSNYEF